MDALGHFAYRDEVWDGKSENPADSASYYGGFKQGEVKPYAGSPLLKLGIEKVPPIITSAILLDARSHLGDGKPLKSGQLITTKDIEAMIDAQGLGWRGILAGDVVYIYTGWGDGWADPVAAGQLQGKAMPPQGMDKGLPFIIHHQNLAVAGIHQIQNANLTKMAADKVWTSCTMILPLRSKGHSGSPVRPVAIGVPNQ